MLLARLLGCFACQCLGEDESVTGLVSITGDLQGNMYVIVIMHCRGLFFFSRGGWILKDDYCYHMTLGSGGMCNLWGGSGGLLSLMISSIWVRLKPLLQMKRLSRWIRLAQFNYWFNQCTYCSTLRCSQQCWLNICFPTNRGCDCIIVKRWLSSASGVILDWIVVFFSFLCHHKWEAKVGVASSKGDTWHGSSVYIT